MLCDVFLCFALFLFVSFWISLLCFVLCLSLLCFAFLCFIFCLDLGFRPGGQAGEAQGTAPGRVELGEPGLGGFLGEPALGNIFDRESKRAQRPADTKATFYQNNNKNNNNNKRGLCPRTPVAGRPKGLRIIGL